MSDEYLFGPPVQVGTSSAEPITPAMGGVALVGVCVHGVYLSVPCKDCKYQFPKGGFRIVRAPECSQFDGEVGQ